MGWKITEEICRKSSTICNQFGIKRYLMLLCSQLKLRNLSRNCFAKNQQIVENLKKLKFFNNISIYGRFNLPRKFCYIISAISDCAPKAHRLMEGNRNFYSNFFRFQGGGRSCVPLPVPMNFYLLPSGIPY